MIFQSSKAIANEIIKAECSSGSTFDFNLFETCDGSEEISTNGQQMEIKTKKRKKKITTAITKEKAKQKA